MGKQKYDKNMEFRLVATKVTDHGFPFENFSIYHVKPANFHPDKRMEILQPLYQGEEEAVDYFLTHPDFKGVKRTAIVCYSNEIYETRILSQLNNGELVQRVLQLREVEKEGKSIGDNQEWQEIERDLNTLNFEQALQKLLEA